MLRNVTRVKMLKDLNKGELEYRRVSRLEDINSSNAIVLLTESKLKTKIEELGLQINKCIDVLSTISGSH